MDNKNSKDETTSQQTIYEKKTQLAALNKNPKNAMDYSNNLSILLNVMGFKSLRPNQTDAVSYLFTGQDLLFVSATGGGKCEAPGTLIRMYDNSIKKIEEIQCGDKVMGPDGTARNVLEIHSGFGPMYKVSYGKNYKESQIVNENHVMVLHLRKHETSGKHNVKEVIKHPIENKEIDHNDFIYIAAKDLYSCSNTEHFLQTTGLCLKDKKENIVVAYKIEKLEGDQHPYYGFSLDGDHLYLHADGLITHNSMVYISAAICMQLKTIIFSPLVSLIQDQADNLRSKGFKVGVINSAVTPREKSLAVALWESGDLDFLFVAPERLQNQDFLNVMVKSPPDFIVVDEIHCAYEHGDNFRASYKLIAPFVKAMKPKLFLGLTATMSPEVEEAVRRIFDLQDTKKICKSYKRDNLHFRTIKHLEGLSSYDIDGMLLNEVNKLNKDGELVPTIVYCSTATMVNKLYQTFGKSVRGGAMMYTGDMSPAEKESNQMRFLQNKIRVAFATNAFGMGIDHPSIGKVIFRTFPSSLEELIQGFGRGGRNGCICDCILYADKTTLNTQKFFIDIGYPSRHIIESFYRGLKMLANEDQLVFATLSDICNTVGVPTTYSSALTQILQGSNIIKRTTIIPESKIRVLDSPPESDKLHKKFETYVSKIEYVGTEEDGYLSFDINFLAKEMGLSVETIKKVLKSFDQLGFIKYIPAARNSPLQIIGDIKTLDFNYLDQKRVEKETKLEEVVEFVDIPDKDKGDFLDDYFDLTNNQ